MTVINGQTAVGATATLLYAADADGCKLIIHNDGGGKRPKPLYLGGPDVTPTTGLALQGTDGELTIRLGPLDKLYAVADGPNARASFLVTYD